MVMKKKWKIVIFILIGLVFLLFINLYLLRQQQPFRFYILYILRARHMYQFHGHPVTSPQSLNWIIKLN